MSEIKTLECEGVQFTVDTDLLDDVDAFENIGLIENKGQVSAIVPLLKFVVGEEGYKDIKEKFTQKDKDEHPDDPNYKGRFRMTKLSKVYEVVIENFNPKS